MKNYNIKILIFSLFVVRISYAQEMHTYSNAASIGNESNSLTGWTTGNITGVVESNEVYDGNYSIKFEAPGNGWYYGKYELLATQGQSYLITLTAKSTSTENPEINIRGDVVNQRYGRLTANWQTFTIPVTASGPSIHLNLYPGLPSAEGNTIYVDALSIIPIGGTDTQVPTTPTIAVTGHTDSTVYLSFSGATDNIGIVGHMVYLNGNYLSNTDGSGSFQVQGLSANTSYTFKVRAVDADGNMSQESNQVSVTTNSYPDTSPPSAPTLSLITTGQSMVEMSWDGAIDDSGITNYKVFKNGILEEILGNVLTYQVTGLSASTTYDFTVTALDASDNESLPSNTVTTTTNSSSGGGSSMETVWSESSGTASYLGKAAIGTSAVPSGYTLAVNGKIIGEELKVQLNGNWPDYVFDTDYEPLSLEEIKKYIEENGHLPNIPSANEIEQNGMEVGEMNRLLLEKIEELTLYILEQNKSQQKLEQRIVELEKNKN